MKQDSNVGGADREARKLIAPIQADMVDLLQKLVQTNSVAVPPLGSEAAAQKVLHKFCKTHRLDVEMYDTRFHVRSGEEYVRHDRNYKGRPNLIARVNGAGRGRSLLLTGHIDTVPQGNGRWSASPWSGLIRGGKLFGRGAFDMKGGLAAHFAAAAALRKAGVRLAGDLLCESVVDEEWAGGGGTLAGRLRGDNADACVVTEGTNLEVVRATRGGFLFEIHASAGDPTAYFSKGEVVSPAVPMGRLLGWIDEWTRRRSRVKPTGAYKGFDDPAPVQVLALEANRFDADVPWSVPLSAAVRVYFQFLPEENVPAVVREIRKSFAAFCKADPFFRAYPPKWKDLNAAPLLGHELPADHPWTKTFVSAAGATLGDVPAVTAAPYPCDAFLMQRKYGIPTLLFGPQGAGAHNADEYVIISSVLKTARTLLAAALDWCG